MDPIFTQQFQMPAPKSGRGGMFGSGGANWQSALMAALAGFMARRNPQVSSTIIGNLQDARQLKERVKMAQEQRAQQLEDQMKLIDYRAAHKEPDDFTQMMTAAGIDPHSEEGQALYRQAVQNKANPFTQMRVQNPDGSETLQFMRPPAIPAAPVGSLKPLGGPTPPASGGFLGY